jgi:hypothetical protein
MNGHKEEEELEKLMKEYTQNFVLCGNCDRPETSTSLFIIIIIIIFDCSMVMGRGGAREAWGEGSCRVSSFSGD